MSQTSFPLRLHDEERDRGKRLAQTLGMSENRLYAELIHDGLLIREQALYMSRLRAIAASSTRQQALDLLDKAADASPVETDLIDRNTGA